LTCPVNCKEVEGVFVPGEEETVAVLVAVVAVAPPHALHKKLVNANTQRSNHLRTDLFVNMMLFLLINDGQAARSSVLLRERVFNY
jgi:hypothetical protein